MKTGKVKSFNDARRWQGRFVHFSSIQAEGFKSFQENQRVSFNVKEGVKDMQATDVRPV